MTYSHFFAMAALLFMIACQSKQEEQQSNSQTTAAAQTLPTGEVIYTAAEGWVAQQPSSSMRKAEFRWPGVEGNEEAEMAVFFFPDAGGSVQANLDRWYGQFKQTDGSTTAQRAHTEKVDASGLAVTVTHVTGIYLKSQSPMMSGPVEEKPNYAMLAAIVETANGPWFFKATGPEATITHWRPSFDAFVKSLRVQ